MFRSQFKFPFRSDMDFVINGARKTIHNKKMNFSNYTQL